MNESVTTYEYDSMNRQRSSREYGANGALLETHDYTYDWAGNRRTDQVFKQGGNSDGSNLNGSFVYTYDDLHRLVSYSGYGIAERQEYKYDGAGHVVYTKSLSSSGSRWTDEYRYNRYDATGKLQDTRAVSREVNRGYVTQSSDIRYHNTASATGLGYDAAGNLMGYQQVSNGSAITTRYAYEHQGSYLQTAATTQRGGTTVTSHTVRDANGFVSNIYQPGSSDFRYDRAFVNDAQGNAVYVNQAAAHTGRIQNLQGGYIGGWVGDNAAPGHVQRQLVVNGEVLARYGDAPDGETPIINGTLPKYVNTSEVYLDAAPLQLKGASVDPVLYTAAGGETLRDVARRVLGDASLWFRIADANSLAISGDAPLEAGLTIKVPRLALNANNAETFQPYDPSRATGSLDPVLPAPSGSGGGCGGLGRIIMVAVAVVAAIYTAGALASVGALGTNAAGAATLAGTTTGGGFAATMTAGASVMGGSAGLGAAAAGGAIGGAVGSIASQGVGIAIGAQEGFDWKGVALAALGGGVAGGLAGSGVLSGSQWNMTAARMATANALTQGVAVVTGLQNSFDWRGVAASAVSGAMGSAVGSALDSADAFGSLGPVGATFARAATTSFAAGAAAAVMRGGRISVQQVASDAFGNALAAGLVSASQRPGEQEQLASAMGAQSVTLVDGTTISAAENLRRIQASGMRLAAGPGYSGGVPHSGDVIVPPYLPGMGYADERNILPTVTVTATPDADDLAERIMGGTQGVIQTAAEAVEGTATLLRNSFLQVGDILTFGMNHGHPVMQQAWAEQSALGQGLVDLAASPRQAATAAIQHASDRYAQAELLRAQGDEFGAARITGHLATSIAAGALGGVQGLRGAAQWGAAGLRAAGVADAQLLMQSVPSLGRQAGALGIEVKAFGNVEGRVPELVGPQMPDTYVSPEMQQKILWGQRQLRADGTPSNGLIGAHSGKISNDLPDYAVELLRNNPDGTSSVKLVNQFSDGNVSKIKNSTLFPSGWADPNVLDAIQTVGAPRNAVATRISDGSTLYQGAVNGVGMEVIKIGNRVAAAYPTGGGFTSLNTFGLTPKPPKP